MIDAHILSRALEALFWLLVAHAVCDYPLQGDFLARAKNHTAPIAGVPAWLALVSHALIHAGGVAAVTQNYTLAASECIAHILIDRAKCAGASSFLGDQVAHVVCKVAWVIWLFRWGLL